MPPSTACSSTWTKFPTRRSPRACLARLWHRAITGTIYAPANGRIGATTVTNHSIGMITEDGLRVFIHVGLGTVEMNGKGFARFVEMGDTVKAGQPLISFDREAIKAAGHEDIVTVIISELDRLKSIDHVGESGTLIGGNPLVKLGDPLLVAKTK